MAEEDVTIADAMAILAASTRVPEHVFRGQTCLRRGRRIGNIWKLFRWIEPGGVALDEFPGDSPTVTRDAAAAALELAGSVLAGKLG
jgi:hypothetical protein